MDKIWSGILGMVREELETMERSTKKRRRRVLETIWEEGKEQEGKGLKIEEWDKEDVE